MSSGENSDLLKLKIFETADSFYEREYPPQGDILVGRSEECDLVLVSRRISKKHCRIFFQNNQWRIEDMNSQNGTILNGSKIVEALLKNGDVIQVGDYRLDVACRPDDAADPDDDRTVVLACPDYDDRTIVRPLPSSIESSQSSAFSGIRAFLDRHQKAAGLAVGVWVVVMVIVLVVSRSGPDDSRETSSLDAGMSSRKDVFHDMETQHRIEVHFQSGMEHLEMGNYSQALVRFQAVLEMDSQNGPARTNLIRAREKLAQAEEQRHRAVEEERKRVERVEVIKSRVRQAMTRNELAGARELVSEAVFLAPDDQDVKRLQADIENTIRDHESARQQQEQQRAEKAALVKLHFDVGQRHYDQKNYRQALQEWETVLAVGVETPETAHTRHAIVQLRNLLQEEIEKDYNEVLKRRRANDLKGALVYLQRVAQVAPDYRDTRQMMDDVFALVESRARRLYQEGLVYEGLGQKSKAAAKWRGVLDVMPFPENQYYQKAREKLQ